MTSFRVRARSKARPGPLEQLDSADRTALEIGPPRRIASGADWPAEEARLAVLWALHRNEVLAEWHASFLPWAVMRFDVPPEARRPGPIRAELVRRGTVPPLSAALEDMTARYSAPAIAATATTRRTRRAATQGDTDHA
jgi:hypothetical protein